MAVPPGNKQVGTVEAVVVTASPISTLRKLDISAIVQKYDSAAPPSSLVKPVRNLMVGTVDSVAVTANPYSYLRSAMVLAVVKYSPPTIVTTRKLDTLAVVQPATVQSPIPVKNLFVGTVEVTAAVTEDPMLICRSMLVLAVVKEFNPRHEHITMNIEYAASAKLNTEDLL